MRCLTAVRADQDVAQVPLLPRHGLDTAQRGQRHAANGPLPLSQGFGRVSAEAPCVPVPGHQADRVSVRVRVLPAKRKYRPSSRNADRK